MVCTECSRSLFMIMLVSCIWPIQVLAQKAIHFDNPGEYLEVNHHNELASKVFTIEFWMRINSLGDPNVASGEMTIIDKRGNDTGYNIRLAGTAFPLPVFAFYQDGAINSPDLIKKNTWHHLAIVQSDSNLSIYVDGDLEGSSTNDNYLGNTEAPLRIGEFLGYPGAYLGLLGELDDLRFWSVARSDLEIKDNMHVELIGNEANLEALWDFDNKFGSQIRNQAANRHHAQIHGNASLVSSDAPIGFVPPNPLTSVRVVGEANHIQIEWEPDTSVQIIHIYRSMDSDFEPNQNNLITSEDITKGFYLDTDVSPNNLYSYRTQVENKDGRFSQNSSSAISRVRPMVNDFMTGVYYYPWYGPTENGHRWVRQYVRDRFIPRQPPLLGHYSSRDTLVIQQHLDWMTAYGIDFLVSSWWGRNSWEDITLASAMLNELEETDIKFSVYYESAIHGIDQGQINITSEARNEIIKNFRYLAENYFDHPNYFKINDRPVVYVYLSGIFAGQYKEAFNDVRQELMDMGHDLYLIGDEMGWDAPDPDHMDFLDGISPYIMFGLDRHEGYPADTDYLAELTMAYKGWEDVANPAGIQIIPNVFPGFNNRELGFGNYAHPRRTAPHRDAQSFLSDYIRVARPFTDPALNMIMITSWNEWHEDSQLEPVIKAPATSTDDTNNGNGLTQGYQYEGYGFQPLETVRTLLSDQSCNLSTSLKYTEVLCSGLSNGYAQIEVRGAVNPTMISWSTGDSTLRIDSLAPGTYSAIVSDGGGCSEEIEFEVAESTEIKILIDSIHNIVGEQPGQIVISVNGGVPPYNYSWYLNEVIFSNEPNPEITVAGTYSLDIVDQLGCMISLDSLTVNMTTSVSEQSAHKVLIYPNPSVNAIVVEWPEEQKANSLRIYNPTGVLLKSFNAFQKVYDVSSLPSGVYIVEVFGMTGRIYEKIIKL